MLGCWPGTAHTQLFLLVPVCLFKFVFKPFLHVVPLLLPLRCWENFPSIWQPGSGRRCWQSLPVLFSIPEAFVAKAKQTRRTPPRSSLTACEMLLCLQMLLPGGFPTTRLSFLKEHLFLVGSCHTAGLTTSARQFQGSRLRPMGPPSPARVQTPAFCRLLQ